ncbi:MAG: hypothetical protein AB7H96_09535 [Vicinamibacterales bacterium]
MLAAALLAALTVAASPDLTRPRLHLDARVEPGVGLDAADLAAVADHAARIWAPLVDLTASLPGAPRAAGAVDRISLLLTNRLLDARHGSLGWIEFVDGEPRREMTVSVAAVARLASAGTWHGRALATMPPAATRTFMQKALGRAVAHEVGHYLLRSTTHDGSGLMRAAFTVDDIMDGRPALGPAARAYAKRFSGEGEVAERR